MKPKKTLKINKRLCSRYIAYFIVIPEERFDGK